MIKQIYACGKTMPASEAVRGEFYYIGFWNDPIHSLVKCIRKSDTIAVFRRVNPGNNKAEDGVIFTLPRYGEPTPTTVRRLCKAEVHVIPESTIWTTGELAE